MLKNSKISAYKIKKILKYFVDDYSASKAQKETKISIRTAERYYNIFRKVTNDLYLESILQYKSEAKYIGYVQDFCREHANLDIYKYNKRLYSVKLLDKEPIGKKFALKDADFRKFAVFFHKSTIKFYGFSKKSYRDQIVERIVRWYYNDKDKFYNAIYEKLKHL